MPTGILMLLDRLARLHACYWERSGLQNPALGLMGTREALRLVAPAMIAGRLAEGDAHPYLPLAAAGWEAFFRLAPAEASATLRAALVHPEPFVAAIRRLPATLVHGDVWGPNLAWLPPTRIAPRAGRRLLLLDWALSLFGPATYDPLWLCGTWHALDPVRVLAVYRARLNLRLAARGIRVLPTVWRAMVDAGYLRTALTCGEALGRTAAEAPAGMRRRRAEVRVRWWAARAARAARRLASESSAQS
jgi:hypothetical protein